MRIEAIGRCSSIFYCRTCTADTQVFPDINLHVRWPDGPIAQYPGRPQRQNPWKLQEEQIEAHIISHMNNGRKLEMRRVVRFEAKDIRYEV